MIGKKFTNISDGRIVEVKDMFEDIVILNDNTKIKTSRLMDKSYFDEYIDPNSFFQNQSLLNTFAQKIKQIPDDILSRIPDEKVGSSNTINESFKDSRFSPMTNESAVILSDPEMEKEELARKYGIKDSRIQMSAQEQAQNQMEKFKSLLDDPIDEPVQKIEVNRDVVVNDVFIDENRIPEATRQYIQPPVQKVEDPIITMFRNVKRNKDFKISIDVVNKIPRPDFIEMMEDSYNTSIIEFLADEFTNAILENPDLIKNKIIEEINNIVYSKNKKVAEPEVKKETRPKNTRTKKVEPTND